MIDHTPPGFIHSKSDAWAEYALKKWGSYGWFNAGQRVGLIPRNRRLLKDRINSLAVKLYTDTGDPEGDTGRAVMAATKAESSFWSNEIRGRIGQQRSHKPNRRYYEKWGLAYADPDGSVRLPDMAVDGGFRLVEVRDELERLNVWMMRELPPGSKRVWQQLLAEGDAPDSYRAVGRAMGISGEAAGHHMRRIQQEAHRFRTERVDTDRFGQ